MKVTIKQNRKAKTFIAATESRFGFSHPVAVASSKYQALADLKSQLKSLGFFGQIFYIYEGEKIYETVQ